MKIKVKNIPYSEVAALKPAPRKKPIKPHIFFRTLIKVLSFFELAFLNFKVQKVGMERLGKKEPCLILMNHSSFIDLKIASSIFYPRPLNIVSTYDSFIGKNWLMRNIGCTPTKKFIADASLVRDMSYALKKLKTSVLMFPEAGYSFDGTATTLPDTLGKLLKHTDVPVIMVTTYGAFARDPLYNGLQLRKVNISAKVEYLLSPEEIKAKSVDELNDIIRKAFSFDNFRWQQEKKIEIKESFRADGLERVLYKCPNCKAEGKMVGKGIHIKCHECGKVYELTELGFIKATEGITEFDHVPNWYNWQRECVKNELENDEYSLKTDVDVYMIIDTKCLYKVGSGTLSHDNTGFTLEGCEGHLKFHQPATTSYSLNADYFWYEIGDVICIGDAKALYYCFPKEKSVNVTKTRLATEELYKLVKSKQ